MKRRIISFLTLLLLTIYGISIIPSEYYTQDMVIHIPVLKTLEDKTLYPRDYTRLYSQAPQENLSLYYPLVKLSKNAFSLSYEKTFRILYVVYLFSYLLIIWKWSEILTNKTYPNGLIASLIILIHFQIGGAAISVVEAEFLPRAIGMVTTLAGAYFFIRKRYFVSSFMYLLSFLLHPLEVFYVLFVTGVFLFLKLRHRIKISPKVLVLILVLSAISIYFISSKMVVSPDWLELIKLRAPYTFMSLWSVKAWLNLFIVLTPGLAYVALTYKQPRFLTKFIYLVYGSTAVFTAVGIIFTEFIPIQQIIILQMGRIWIYSVLVSIITIPVLISKLPKKKFLALICIPIIIALGLMFNNRDALKTNYRYLENWLTLQNWARNNTSNNCLFLVPFYSKGFRMESERSILGEDKDGGHSLYSFKMAQLWIERKQDLANWEEVDDERFKTLFEKYRFDYFVTTSKKIYPYTLVYKNQEYGLYKVNKNSTCAD